LKGLLTGIAHHEKPISELRSIITCHTGSHGVTCHLIQKNVLAVPHLKCNQTGHPTTTPRSHYILVIRRSCIQLYNTEICKTYQFPPTSVWVQTYIQV